MTPNAKQGEESAESVHMATMMLSGLKMMLSGMNDVDVAALLPGAPRIAALEAQNQTLRAALERIATSEPGAHYVATLREWARRALEGS